MTEQEKRRLEFDIKQEVVKAIFKVLKDRGLEGDIPFHHAILYANDAITELLNGFHKYIK